jgi:hypothetical protein
MTRMREDVDIMGRSVTALEPDDSPAPAGGGVANARDGRCPLRRQIRIELQLEERGRGMVKKFEGVVSNVNNRAACPKGATRSA